MQEKEYLGKIGMVQWIIYVLKVIVKNALVPCVICKWSSCHRKESWAESFKGYLH